jgi:hypothetical protein
MGVITGDPKWLAAVDGAWDMLRASWLHVGGSVAINEAQLYPPGSYFLEPPNPDWQHPTPTPTGELCGSSFWIKLNQRLQRLRPDVEAYAAEHAGYQKNALPPCDPATRALLRERWGPSFATFGYDP